MPPAMPGRTEAAEQMDVVRWFRVVAAAAHDLDPRLLFAIPNGGTRGDKRECAILRASGVVAGVPDLFLAVPTTDAAGLFVEMKRASGGRPSSAQLSMADALTAAGYAVKICHGADEAKTVILTYLLHRQTTKG